MTAYLLPTIPTKDEIITHTVMRLYGSCRDEAKVVCLRAEVVKLLDGCKETIYDREPFVPSDEARHMVRIVNLELERRPHL